MKLHIFMTAHSTCYRSIYLYTEGFPDSSSGKESICDAGDASDIGWISGSERSPGEGNGNLLQYSCLGNALDRGAWRATVPGVAKSQTWLSRQACSISIQMYFRKGKKKPLCNSINFTLSWTSMKQSLSLAPGKLPSLNVLKRLLPQL